MIRENQILKAIEEDLSDTQKTLTYKQITINYLTNTLNLTKDPHINTILRVSFANTKLNLTEEEIKKELTKTDNQQISDSEVSNLYDFLLVVTGYQDKKHLSNIINKKVDEAKVSVDDAYYIAKKHKQDIEYAVNNANSFGTSRAVAIAVGVIIRQYNNSGIGDGLVSNSTASSKEKELVSGDMQRFYKWIDDNYILDEAQKQPLWNWLNSVKIRPADWLDLIKAYDNCITGIDALTDLKQVYELSSQTQPIKKESITIEPKESLGYMGIKDSGGDGELPF